MAQQRIDYRNEGQVFGGGNKVFHGVLGREVGLRKYPETAVSYSYFLFGVLWL